MKKQPHESHDMTKWRDTIVTLVEIKRFGGIRECKKCCGKHVRTAAGEGIHDELL